MNVLEITLYRGREIETVVEELAALRIVVFRDFPYLYQGSQDYERDYLRTYHQSQGALLALLRDGEKAVGATTCIPLPDETEEVKAPFLEAGFSLEEVFYFGESILLSQYRGQGWGKRFFELREKHAAGHNGCRWMCFCAVDRPNDHPSRPADYRPLDGFWMSRGYRPRPDLKTGFAWQDIGEEEETVKPMAFWMKEIKRREQSV